MAITIKHLDGPLAGQEQHFDDSVEIIIFGRSQDCQVVYPEECTLVGRQHFALLRAEAGDYRIILSGGHYVAVDGVRAEHRSLVRSGAIISLGHPGGPSFRVELQSESAERERWMADIAVEAEADADESISRYPAEPFETAVDLLFKRWSEPPAVVAGLPDDVALRQRLEPEPSSMSSPPPPVRVGASERSRGSADPWLEDLLQENEAQSPPKGVGSGGPPHSRPADSPRLERHRDTLPNRPAPPEVHAEYAPRAQMGMRRNTGLFWWIALALGAGLIGYLLFSRGIALGAALGKLFPAAAPPPPAPKAAKGDLVDVSVFGPTAIKAGGEGLIQIFLHHLSQREIAKALAKEVDPEATRRGVQTLAAEIAEGQRVQIMLDARGLGVDQEMQTLVWRGEPCACQFTLTAPGNAAGRTFHPRVLVLVDSVPVGSLTFSLKVSKEETAEPELRGDRARRYAYAFLSYASQDRAEVIKRAQGLKAGGTRFFNDLLSLEPGERWKKRLYEEIDRCDVFYLFWSSRAKASEWVMKEIEYALARRAASPAGDPDIIPVIIEGPPPPAPPESLKDIHFNDSLIYVLASGDARH